MTDISQNTLFGDREADKKLRGRPISYLTQSTWADSELNLPFWQCQVSTVLTSDPYSSSQSVGNIGVVSQGTWASSLPSRYFAETTKTDIISHALREIEFSKPQPMISLAIRILTIIQSKVNSFRAVSTYLDDLPQLRATAPEDDSLLIEWNFEGFRIGFNIEPDPNENSWYLISNTLGKVNASGYLPDSDIESIVSWLIIFAILSSLN
jgi:hypothetical protein